MEAFADPEVNEIVIVCASQSAKTLTALCLLCWAVAEDPGPTLWTQANTTEATKFSKARLMPMLEKCELTAAKLPASRTSKTTKAIYFPGAPLIIAGVTDTNALESMPYRYLFHDEVHKYPPGTLQKLAKRARSYPNYKRLIISTGSDENDQLHLAYLAGDQRQYEVRCPKCGNYHALDWGTPETTGGMKWDTNEKTRPNGEWDWEELFKTVRYRCWNKDCDHEWRDEIAARKLLQATGRWVARNPRAPRKIRSYQWGGPLPWWTNWSQMVEEFLNASKARKYGDHEPLKVFYTRTLGLWFADRHRYAREEAFLEKRKQIYNPLAPWEPEVRRFLTIDVQGKGGRHFWWVARAWARGGASRLLAFGKAWSIAEVRSVQSQYGILPQNVGIDAGHFTAEVYGYIMESGVLTNGDWAWKALKGDKGDGYFIDGIKQAWTFSYVDPYLGKRGKEEREEHPIRQLLFSKQALLDRQELVMRGLDVDWAIPREASVANPAGPDNAQLHEYMLQVTAYERMEERDTRGVIIHRWHQKRPEDHLGSCERMQLACAMAAPDVFVAPAPPPRKNRRRAEAQDDQDDE